MASADGVVASPTTNTKKLINFLGIHERNVGTLRKLLEVTLPVGYANEWYADVLKTPGEYTKMGAC
jgi:hypothetical protein